MSRVGTILGAGMLLWGAVVRVIVYFQNRSIFMDEANLTFNVAERDWSGLFAALDYQQYAPPLFMWMQKAAWLLIGHTEYAIRFFPLLFGLGSLILFFSLCRHYLKNPGPFLFSCWLMAFLPIFIRYSTEGKQYSLDVFITLALIYSAIKITPKLTRRTSLIFWTLFGSLCIWLSMPSVFVLTGIGLVLFFREKKKVDLSALIPISVWIFNFGLFYFLLLQPSIQSDYLQNFHDQYFFNPISRFDDSIKILMNLIAPATGYTVAALTFGLPALLFGIYRLLRNQVKDFFLLVGPILFCLLASALHQYSLINRLVLFLFPLLILIVAIGYDRVFSFKIKWLAPVLFFGMIANAASRNGFRYTWLPYKIEEVRLAFNEINEKGSPDDLIVANWEAVAPVRFYREYYKHKDQYQFPNFRQLEWNEDPRPETLNLDLNKKRPDDLVATKSFTL